jgi:hypothetical protein
MSGGLRVVIDASIATEKLMFMGCGCVVESREINRGVDARSEWGENRGRVANMDGHQYKSRVPEPRSFGHW